MMEFQPKNFLNKKEICGQTFYSVCFALIYKLSTRPTKNVFELSRIKNKNGRFALKKESGVYEKSTIIHSVEEYSRKF